MGNSGGVSASRGFDYQDKVAAFLLLWANTHEDFESLEIESSFGDDIFINLTSSQPNTQAVIRVSVKTKAANYQWEASEIRDMLLKTNEDRGVGNTQPNLLAQIVADINQKLLFITDGSANIKLSGLRAKDIENPFERLSIPQSDHDSFAQIRQSVSKEKQDAVDLFLQAKTTLVFQRIFMCTGMTGRDIEARAFVLLNKHYRVPYSQHDPCWKSLVEKAKNARYSSNSKDRIFSRLNIQRLVAPLAVSAPYPDVADYFFATRDYSECLQRLTNEHMF